MSTQPRKGIIIAGPTGIGKTDLAMELGKLLDGELVSCDSVQVYRDLNIGANKTDTSPIPQHLIDLVPWTEPFTAADFLQHCSSTVADILSRNKVPILVGGTGLYLEWIVEGRPASPATDEAVLREVQGELAKCHNWDEAWTKLNAVDPVYATSIMKNDLYRLTRALTVHRMTGRPLSSFPRRNEKDKALASVQWCCLYLSFGRRVELLKHIDRRCEGMILKGLLRETAELREVGLNRQCQAGRSIGYEESLSFLEKIDSLSQGEKERDGDGRMYSNAAAIDKAFLEYIKDFQSHTRQYTRKQEKWFATKDYYHWIDRGDLNPALSQKVIQLAVDLFKGETDANDTLVQSCKDFRLACRSEKSESGKARKVALREYRPELVHFREAERRHSFLKDFLRSHGVERTNEGKKNVP